MHWRDPDGTQHEAALPCGRFHEQSNALVQELANDGLEIVPGRERELLAYLASFKPENRVRSVPRLGWLDAPDGRLAFVLNRGETIGDQRERIAFQPERHAPTVRTIRAQGSLEDWQREVAERARGNPFLEFALCCGFAGPLLRAAESDGCGFHLYGRTSRGKTTWLQVAASVWGCAADPALAPEQAIIRRWNTTANGAEGLAAAHNDTGLFLDEIGSCSAHDFGGLVYNLTGGQGKAAMDANRNLKEQRTWRALILSTGEIASCQRIEQDGRAHAKAGQRLRLIDIPFGEIIADPHGDAPAEFADKLKHACGCSYGTAGPAFVRALIEEHGDAQTLRNCTRETVEFELRLLLRNGAGPEVTRAARRFALVAAAGQAAVRYGLLPLNALDPGAAVRAVFDAWRSGPDPLPDAERGVQAVRDFILRHQARFADLAPDAPPPRECVGCRDQTAGLWLFHPQGFTEACADQDARSVAQELKRRGLLSYNEEGRLTLKRSVAALGDKRVRFYAVREALIAGEEDDSPAEGDELEERAPVPF